MGPKHNLVHYKSLLGCLFIRAGLVPSICMLEKMKGNLISTFPPSSSLNIGEVIQTWLARLIRWDLGSSPKHFNWSSKLFLFHRLKITLERKTTGFCHWTIFSFCFRLYILHLMFHQKLQKKIEIESHFVNTFNGELNLNHFLVQCCIDWMIQFRLLIFKI